ncbi:hypothetical protein J437_LFUL002983, partial [Ladona fulva]
MEVINKGPGIDQIKIKDIKSTPSYWNSKNLINQSLYKGTVPDGLKIAVIKPIPKGKLINDYSNFRPISILSSIHKILEKYVVKYLTGYAKKFNLISETNLGKRNLVEKFFNYIYKHLYRDNHIIAVFIDLKKAFDIINHKILLNKLYKIGVRGNYHEWFKSYLHNRKLFSGERNVPCGVPQGSVLGPILFILYLFMCNDDAVLMATHKDFDTAISLIKEDLSSICKWCHDNDMSINENKTKVMHITNRIVKQRNVKIKIHNHNCLHLHNEEELKLDMCLCEHIEQVSNHRYLGVILDENYKFDAHI